MKADQLPQRRGVSPPLDEPVFCFTSDMEWSPEWAIGQLLTQFDARGVPLTPFLTHESGIVRERYSQAGMAQRVGLHPNFFPSSSHGETMSEVIDFVCSLWPNATAFRSHLFFDHTQVTEAFARRGFRYDSNLCLFLQPNCVPLLHNSGMLRFPVFWQDDVHLRRELPIDLSAIRDDLDSPGLKVINIHPFLFALNAPSIDFYAAHKHLNMDSNMDDLCAAVFDGKGVRTLVENLLGYVQAQGYRCVYLNDLFLELAGDHVNLEAANPHSAGSATSGGSRELYDEYQSASGAEKAELVQTIFDNRDPTELYTTSRDFNMRELEIGFIARHFKPRDVLDIGCGNGYTLLALAKNTEANYIGLDFSANLIEGAKSLTKQLASELLCRPVFREGDVRKLPFDANKFDCVISERCLQNLPSEQDQHDTIREIHRVLRPGGVYVMVEGIADGLSRLNRVRTRLGLDAIPPTSPENPSALRFDEAELSGFLEKMFIVETVQFFGTYYLISRVVHPLLVHPDSPRFDAKINSIARQVADVLPDTARLGHVAGYKLVAKK